MSKLTQAACAGAVLLGLLGAAGCSASADSEPEPTPTVTISPAAPSTDVSILPRQNVRVVVNPTSIAGGATKNVRVTAFCPPAQPGTTYKANARSDAFTGIVSLMPPLPPTPAPSPAPEPRLTGVALLSANAKAGGYKVEVRCEATNDIGSARLKVTAPSSGSGNFPTKAPGAGGGGTAAGGPEDAASGVPIMPMALGLIAVVVLGIGVARMRNRV
ncbi:hypothetical protein [Acrocarpospora catenulata]|uniref:hypothetical protein n=1 Tax=Acrocarpospora catenulata TaxID=2836182 RepID=UPI001BD9B5E4|nr:hypothetical protein [Acrocarpospora catenulata]